MTILTAEHINLVERSEIEALEDRLQRVQQINNNEMGVELKRFGTAMAFSVKNIPGPSFNTVKGLSSENIGDIEAMIDFYASKDIPARFEITPANATKELFQMLSQKGFYQSGFHASLYKKLPEVPVTETPSIKIEEISLEDFHIFGELYTEGFGMPGFLKDYVTTNNKILAESDSWCFYVASINNEPAGVAVLFMKEDVATLAASATISAFRNKGVQTALIQKRIQKATDSGCRFLVGQAAYGSISQKNMERAGMKLAYTNAVWEKVD